MAEADSEKTENKSDARFAAQCSDFLRNYVPPQPVRSKDTLDGRYRIDLSIPLPALNTKNGTAYAVNDIVDGSRRLYALVCKPQSIIRHNILDKLKRLSHPNIIQLIAYGTVNLSQPDAERFVLVYERPLGQKLSEVLANTGALGEHFLARNLVAPLANMISELVAMDITHGRINPDNIYYQDGPVLGECASEPCGYSQHFYYEPLERMQAHPAGKGNGNNTTDFYALAVLLIECMFGKEHFANYPRDNLINRMFEEGTYYALTKNLTHPERFNDFLRGVLNHNPSDRWTWKYIKPWTDGRRLHVLEPPTPIETSRPFEFKKKIARSRRELAHLLFENWVNIPEAINNNQVIQWTSISLRNKSLSESLSRIIKIINELGTKNELQFNEQLMNILLVLDPAGPIRMSPLAMYIDGIETLCTEYYFSKQEKEFNLLARFIDMNMASSWISAQSTYHDYQPPQNIKDANQKLDKLRINMHNTGIGFGIERIIYDLNPEMPCLSPILEGRYINTIPALLARLDNMAGNLSRSAEPMDRHIFAYLAAKLGLQHDIKLLELDSIPALSKNRDIMLLKLLSQAQYRCGNMQFPGLTHWLAARILPALDCIRGASIRQQVKEAVLAAAETGYTQNLAAVVIDAGYSSADTRGYANAYNVFHLNIREIAALRNGHGFDTKSSRLALNIAKILSYIVFCVTLYSVSGGNRL